MTTEAAPAGQANTPAAGATTTPAAGTTETPAAGAATTTSTTPAAGEGTTAEPASAAATPTVPDKYTLTLPDGSPFQESDLIGFASEAKALGLTNDAAQKLVDTRAEQIRQAADTYLEELRADPILGGAKFEESVDLAVKGRDVLFPPGSEEADLINDWFERTGLGNHRLLVRAFARLGAKVAEDGTTNPRGSGGEPKKERTVGQILYDAPTGAGQG